ncbi:MAG TPA: HK97 gp10 family phage protein, partial [Accumulibacter sp.]|nr:HK97 gp10 family phage protein [Accumulibacter sp.]
RAMNGKPFELEVKGLDKLKAALQQMPDRIRKRAVGKALRAAGRVIRDEARARVPILSEPSKNRRPGVLKRAIAVRRSKIAARQRLVGVFINVRPLKSVLAGTKSATRKAALGPVGANNPNDPFYWRFIEFGTRKMRARPFLADAAKKLPQAADVFIAIASEEINRLNTKT